MFDSIFGRSEYQMVNYDHREEFNSEVEPIIDELNNVADKYGIPLIVIGCISHKEEEEDSGVASTAGMLVAAQGRNTEKGIWYPDMMGTLLEVITHPKLIRLLDHLMPVLKSMSETMDGGRPNRVVGKGFDSVEESKDFLRGILDSNFFEGDEDDEDEEED